MTSNLLAAPDKFKGSATAADAAEAIAAGAAAAGWAPVAQPLSDGGEGLVDLVGGPNRLSEVTGPTGRAVLAPWRFDDDPPCAYIEMSAAAGLVLAGGPLANNPVTATTAGVGELILAAVREGASRIVVGCGGSATTDGGKGAVDAIGSPAALVEASVVVACDVRIGFLEAARLFGAQKGATAQQIEFLEHRLGDVAGELERRFGTNVVSLPFAGAAGGLAGGLAALGGTLVEGFEFVADITHLDMLIARADAIVTGEGCLDAQSFAGKVTGGVACRARGRPVACVAGRSTEAGRSAARSYNLDVLDLTETFGETEALTHPLESITEIVTRWLTRS